MNLEINTTLIVTEKWKKSELKVHVNGFETINSLCISFSLIVLFMDRKVQICYPKNKKQKNSEGKDFFLS